MIDELLVLGCTNVIEPLDAGSICVCLCVPVTDHNLGVSGFCYAYGDREISGEIGVIYDACVPPATSFRYATRTSTGVNRIEVVGTAFRCGGIIARDLGNVRLFVVIKYDSIPCIGRRSS